MWEQVHGFFSEQIKSNMLLQGGLALSVLGGAAVIGKQWLFALWAFIVKKTIFTVRIDKDVAEELYLALTEYFQKRVEGLGEVSLLKDIGYPIVKVPRGRFLMWKKATPIMVNFFQERLTAATYARQAFRNGMTISGILAKKKMLDILDTAINEYERNNRTKDGFVRVYKMTQKDGLKELAKYKPKPLDDIVMDHEDHAKMLNALDGWRNSEERYVKLGLPYKMGFMFHGAPGTGKTSLAYSIARHLGYDIVICSLFGIGSEVDFKTEKCVYVFDDIDREMGTSESVEVEGIGQVGEVKPNIKLLLSLLDARLTAHKSIIVMSCNDIHAVDEAVFRPGRVDMVMEFRPPTKEMAETFMTKFYGERVVLPKFFPGRSMSFYQTCCLRYMDSPKGAVKEACDEMSNINYNPKGLIENVPAKRMMAVEAA